MVIHDKLITLNKGGIAVKLLQNKDNLKQYLLKENWTKGDMTIHSWFKTHNAWNCWGKNNGSKTFIAGKGVTIYPSGAVCIGHTNEEDGRGFDYPYIQCTDTEYN